DFGQEPPGPADEGFALQIFVPPGPFADKNQLRPRISHTKDDVRAALTELAAATVPYFGAQLLKRLYGLHRRREKKVAGLGRHRRGNDRLCRRSRSGRGRGAGRRGIGESGSRSGFAVLRFLRFPVSPFPRFPVSLSSRLSWPCCRRTRKSGHPSLLQRFDVPAHRFGDLEQELACRVRGHYFDQVLSLVQYSGRPINELMDKEGEAVVIGGRI